MYMEMNFFPSKTNFLYVKESPVFTLVNWLFFIFLAILLPSTFWKNLFFICYYCYINNFHTKMIKFIWAQCWDQENVLVLDGPVYLCIRKYFCTD